jgi:hypothetical protein
VTATPRIDLYDQYASEYARMVAARDQRGLRGLPDLLIPPGCQFPYFMILSFLKPAAD